MTVRHIPTQAAPAAPAQADDAVMFDRIDTHFQGDSYRVTNLQFVTRHDQPMPDIRPSRHYRIVEAHP